jgi:hypothetical protein
MVFHGFRKPADQADWMPAEHGVAYQRVHQQRESYGKSGPEGSIKQPG